MPAVAPPIHSSSAKGDVLAWMNWSKGEIYWNNHSGRWKNLLVARNDFIMRALRDQLLSIEDYKLLDRASKRYYIDRTAAAFSDGSFLEYTRDTLWKQDAMGDQDDWTRIQGMAQWHIKWGFSALSSRADKTAAPAAIATSGEPRK